MTNCVISAFSHNALHRLGYLEVFGRHELVITDRLHMYPCFTDSKRCQTAKTPQKSPWRRKIPVSRAPSFQAGPPSCLLILCGLTVYGKRAREHQAGGGVSPPPLQISVPHVSEFSSHMFKGCCFSFAVFPRWYECSLSRGSFTAFSQPTLSDRLCAPREKCNSP